tara:strand:- start:186 stop:509 length:324 start_codon:yes stop_codon:yes gene_type:complete
MKVFKIFLLLILVIIISSCGTVKDAFNNQKKNSSDEFLVEKKSPLSMPPDYGKLPIPKTTQNQIENEDEKIKNLISDNENSIDQKNKNSNNQNQDFEQKLLEKIKQN